MPSPPDTSPENPNTLSEKWTIILAMGGPGTGKGTQCNMLQLEFKVWHLDIHNILLDEIMKPGSIFADMIRACITSGETGSPELGVKLLKAAMTEASEKHGASTFLIEGFPRILDQAQHFESEIGVPFAVFFFDCPFQVLTTRLARRAHVSGFFDGNAVDMEERTKAFDEWTRPIIERYREKSRFIHIDASGNVLKVYNVVKKHWRHLSTEIVTTKR